MRPRAKSKTILNRKRRGRWIRGCGLGTRGPGGFGGYCFSVFLDGTLLAFLLYSAAGRNHLILI